MINIVIVSGYVKKVHSSEYRDMFRLQYKTKYVYQGEEKQTNYQILCIVNNEKLRQNLKNSPIDNSYVLVHGTLATFIENKQDIKQVLYVRVKEIQKINSDITQEIEQKNKFTI